jgi:hypothetical protein
VTADINSSLEALCAKLGEESLNYGARVRLFSSPRMAGRSVTDTVSAALGTAVVIGGTNSTDRAKFIQAIKDGLEYVGDESSFPNRAFLASDQFQKQKEEILRFFDGFILDADQLIWFWLKKGHPFYPVFWDFAFVIEKGADSFVLIGSSSD